MRHGWQPVRADQQGSGGYVYGPGAAVAVWR